MENNSENTIEQPELNSILEQQRTMSNISEETSSSNNSINEQQVEEQQIVEEPPVVEPLVIEEQAVEEQVVKEQVVEEPPVIEEPVVEEPVVEENVVEKQVVEEPVVEENVVEKQVVEEPVVEEPVVEENVVEEQVIEKQVVEEPVVEEPVVEENVVEEPVVEEPVVEENVVEESISNPVIEQKVIETVIETEPKSTKEKKNITESLETLSLESNSIKNESVKSESLKSVSFSSDIFKENNEENNNKSLLEIKAPELYESVKELLKSENIKDDFIKIVPMLMFQVNIYNISLSGFEKKELVIDFLIAMLEDSENELYRMINLEDNIRNLLAYVCPNMIDICYNISKNGLKKDFPNYDNKVVMDEELLLKLLRENITDFDFENNNLSKREFVSKFFGLLFAIISFIEMANVQNFDSKAFVIKVGKELLKEKQFEDTEFYNYFDIIVNMLYSLITGTLTILEASKINCRCNCFGFFSN